MKTKVLLFASVKDQVGKGEIELELPAGTTAKQILQRLLSEKGEECRWNQHMLFAVNERMVPPETVLQDGDELALIPPVSGG